MSLPDVWAQIAADQRNMVLRETWGHLAPKKNKTYKGRIVYAIGCYDSGNLNPTALVADFEDLSDSPWFYDALQEFMRDIAWRIAEKNAGTPTYNEPGEVYEWVGTFRNYEFKGRIRKVFDANKPVGE